MSNRCHQKSALCAAESHGLESGLILLFEFLHFKAFGKAILVATKKYRLFIRPPFLSETDNLMSTLRPGLTLPRHPFHRRYRQSLLFVWTL